MKYIKPPDFKAVKEFEEKYRKIEQEIAELLTTDGSARTASELKEKLSQALNLAVSYLTNESREFTKTELPQAFQEGKDSVKDEVKKTKEEAAAILEKQGFKYAKNAFTQDTYIELHENTILAFKGVQKRVNKIIKRLRKTGDDSIYNVQQEIYKDLVENGITITYANGAKQPLHSYAAMAARSARIESANIGTIGRALQAGTDLVKMTEMPQCCKLCGAYQGKVYSISGNDKRFPALFKTVLKSGYALPHPNCRHEFIPFFEEIEAPEDVEKAIKNSKIKYGKNGNLIDVRYQRDISAYAKWQAGNRQRNAELKEYERMKTHYAGREEEMPYKSLAGFRRARRADELSPAFKAWRYRERDKRQYEEWIKKLGKENMPEDIDKFQEIKYNVNNTKYERMKALVQQETDYEEAKNGGKHSGKYQNFVAKYRIRELEKSIRSYNRTIEEHKQKISNPKKFYPDWDDFDDRYKEGLLRKWEKDKTRNIKERNIAIGVLKDKKKNENSKND